MFRFRIWLYSGCGTGVVDNLRYLRPSNMILYCHIL